MDYIPLILSFSLREKERANKSYSISRTWWLRMTMKERAKALRVRQTDAERLLWSRLRNRQFAGHKFRRQEVIGAYIVDFVCLEAKLIIEVDGGQHGMQIEYDAKRSKYLNSRGFTVLRFWNNDVLSNVETVLESIRLELIVFPLPPGEGQGEGNI